MDKENYFSGFMNEIKDYLHKYPGFKENKIGKDFLFGDIVRKTISKEIKGDIVNFLVNQRVFWLQEYKIDFPPIDEFICKYPYDRYLDKNEVLLFHMECNSLFQKIEDHLNEKIELYKRDESFNYSKKWEKHYEILKCYHHFLEKKYDLLIDMVKRIELFYMDK